MQGSFQAFDSTVDTIKITKSSQSCFLPDSSASREEQDNIRNPLTSHFCNVVQRPGFRICILPVVTMQVSFLFLSGPPQLCTKHCWDCLLLICSNIRLCELFCGSESLSHRPCSLQITSTACSTLIGPQPPGGGASVSGALQKASAL